MRKNTEKDDGRKKKVLKHAEKKSKQGGQIWKKEKAKTEG